MCDCCRLEASSAKDGIRFTCEQLKRERLGVVNLGYVVNVVESPAERVQALQEAWHLTKSVLIVTARLKMEELGSELTPFGDGFLTGRGTFQKFYDQGELREWIDAVLGVSSVPATPGVFYIFRNPQQAESFRAQQYERRRTRTAQDLADQFARSHQHLFEPVVEFVFRRGRFPEADEVEAADGLSSVLGSRRRAVNTVSHLVGADKLRRIKEERVDDLLVYLALARFGRRPRWGGLPLVLQRDIRALFGTYRRACQEADDLLFSAGDRENLERGFRAGGLGKLMPTALYVHVSALIQLPAIVRVYEGCARRYIGTVEGANIVKLHRFKFQVSYLSYPNFDKDPHPALAATLVVPLQTFHIRYRNYTEIDNPPILHRKEEFVSDEHLLKARFARLTRQEERKGLFHSPADIGTSQAWSRLLASKRLRLRGHQLVREK